MQLLYGTGGVRNITMLYGNRHGIITTWHFQGKKIAFGKKEAN